MRVLYITNMYPGANKSFKYQGVFVKEQIDSIVKNFPVKHDLYLIKGFDSKVNYLTSVIHIARLLILKTYDIIHIHFGLSALFLFFIPFYPKRKIILTLHGTDIQPEGNNYLTIKITRQLIKRVGTVIALNEKMVNEVKNYNPNVVLLPCGVDTDLFSGQRKAYDENLILFPGDPKRPVKNYPLFRKVIEILREKYKLNVQPAILHNLTREEVKNMLLKGGCLLMTSLSEGSPQIIKESMATNLKIVTTNVGDVSFLLHGLNNATVVNSFDSEKIAKAVHDILNKTDNNELRDRLMKLGYDNRAIASRVMQLYNQNV